MSYGEINENLLNKTRFELLKLPKKTTTYSKEEENIYQKLKEDEKYYI